jgi:competence protein ComEA
MKSILFALLLLLVSGAASAALNLNTATKDELVGLPGVGPAKAQAIVDYRNQHGPFRSLDELRKVKGIGEKLFLQLKPELTLGNAPRSTGAQAQVKSASADAKSDATGQPRTNAGTIAKDDKAKK